MPTARELLEQADALMRRNRGREPEPDIPELTDEVAIAQPDPVARRPSAPQPAPPPRRAPADDVPELTDAVARIEEISVPPVPDEGEDSRWLDTGLGAVSVTGLAPDSIAVVPPATLRPTAPAANEAAPPPRPPGSSDEHKLSAATAAAALASSLAGTLSPRVVEPPASSDRGFDAMLGLPPAEAEFERELAPPEPPPAFEAPVEPPRAPEPVEAAPPAAEATPPAASPSWDAVAEEIRMQVLQRIDIFTDTGLQGELAARLQPVVDRASADLVATINREVGQLLRAYVAEAIEREIEKWRQANP